MRIRIFVEENRLKVATILVKKGYQVRQGKEKRMSGVRRSEVARPYKSKIRQAYCDRIGRKTRKEQKHLLAL